jgi:hypothetical protein
MERVNDHIVSEGSKYKKGRSIYLGWYHERERDIKMLLGLDKPKGYDDYKRQIKEMKEIQDARKGKK